MPSFERPFSLHVPSSTENLSMIRDFVRSIGSQAGMSEMDVARLEMAVDEACSNAGPCLSIGFHEGGFDSRGCGRQFGSRLGN